MTQSLNRQNLSLDDQRSAQLDIYDANGRLDPIATAEANREIFQESNTVKIPGSTAINVPATAAARVAAKAAVLARRK
jgi:hypothetical protein